MALESWTPLIGQWTRMSTRDGNFGHTRLNSPLKLWKETQRRPRSPICTIGLNGEGISKIEGWKNSKILISQSDYDELPDKTGKYSLDKIGSYFTLCELALTPRSNPLLAVEDLYLAKQGSVTSGEFHSHILKIVKRCQFPCQKAEGRAVRDAIFMGMNSQQARDKAINLMNEEEKEVTVEFLMNHLAVEDDNTQHKFLSQINSNSSVNFAAYDRRQNGGKSNKPKHTSGKNGVQNKTSADFFIYCLTI